MTKKTHLIFMFSYSPTVWDITRYGLDTFAENGIKIEAFDLSSLISTRSNQGAPSLAREIIKKILSYDMLEAEIIKNKNHAIYVDCINGLNGFQWQGRKIFKLFKQYDVHYYLIEIGSLPLINDKKTASWIDKLKKIRHFKKIKSYVLWKAGKKLAHWQFIYFNAYQLPKKIFVGHTDLLAQYLYQYQLSEKAVVPIHSFDYDLYLDYVRNNDKKILETAVLEEKICVFIDQDLGRHCDFGSAVSYRPITPKKYLASLNQFFDKVEQETGLQVVIAASPRMRDDAAADFKHRKVIKNKTMALIAESELVLMHSSTAVSFAVLFNKPILLIKTAEMLNAPGFGHFMNNMASTLQLQAICIDYANELSQLHLNTYPQWEKNYDHYKYKYVMTKGLHDKTICDIVTDEFRKHQ